MDDIARHPDDELLFDLAAGGLDDDRADRVRAHLRRCAACAAFVEAASVGAEAVTMLGDSMPDAASEQLHAALRGAWRERRDAIAAAELAADDRIATTPVEPGEFAPPPRRARRARRRLVPVLALVVLAALAGTSVYIGQHETSAPDSAPSTAGRDTESDHLSDAPAPAAESAPSEEVAPSADSASGGYVSGRGSTTAVADEPVERVCIATRDETMLYLPDGRIAQLIVAGPLGIYVVCG